MYMLMYVCVCIFVEVSGYLPSPVNDVVAKFTSQSTADRADAKVNELTQFSSQKYVWSTCRTCLICVFQGSLRVEDILRLSRYLTRDEMLLLQEKFQERCKESDEVSFRNAAERVMRLALK